MSPATTHQRTSSHDKANDDDSDIELEGVDLDDDEPADEDLGELEKNNHRSSEIDESYDDAVDEREHEDHDEYEEARKERMELMASEAKQVAGGTTGGLSNTSNKATVEEQLNYLLGQSEVFAHFLAGKLL
jgi:hypothetical protein